VKIYVKIDIKHSSWTKLARYTLQMLFPGQMSRAIVGVAYTRRSNTDSAVLANCHVCESDAIIM